MLFNRYYLKNLFINHSCFLYIRLYDRKSHLIFTYFPFGQSVKNNKIFATYFLKSWEIDGNNFFIGSKKLFNKTS